LRVVYVPDQIPRSVFVVTAYDLVGKPLAAYRRRRRRR
jgi:CBS domain-containing protein